MFQDRNPQNENAREGKNRTVNIVQKNRPKIGNSDAMRITDPRTDRERDKRRRQGQTEREERRRDRRETRQDEGRTQTNKTTDDEAESDTEKRKHKQGQDRPSVKHLLYD